MQKQMELTQVSASKPEELIPLPFQTVTEYSTNHRKKTRNAEHKIVVGFNKTNVTPTPDDEDTAIYGTDDLRHQLRVHQIFSKKHKLRAQIGAGLQNYQRY